MATPDDDLRFLSGTKVRRSVLERLRVSPAKPSDLVTATGASRTTVHRTLSELLDRDWIYRNNGQYVLSPVGDRALGAYHTACDRFRTIDRCASLLACVDSNSPFPDLEWLADATIVTADEGDPQCPYEWYDDRLDTVSGDRLAGIAPTITRQIMAIHADITLAGTPTELVIDEETLQRVRNRYPESLPDSADIDTYELYVAESVPSYGMTMFDDVVFLSVFDDAGHLHGVLESTDARLYDWAQAMMAGYRNAATRLSDSNVLSSPSS